MDRTVKVRVKSKRKVPCAVCGGTGFVYTVGFTGEPLLWSATECEGVGEVPEVPEVAPLTEVLAPEPLDDGTEL
ncbi:hypothetical protein [Thermus sp.]|uniref:hypothetical protein n=1 Tax=Thermus sp. TaxID=275 RepID=UPI003D14FDDE